MTIWLMNPGVRIREARPRMDRKLDRRDRELLRTLQDDFPISRRPFRAVAERLDWT
ncbi:MAG: hypothetical protein ACE5IO_02555, partial [Thermoplasmata archaeon]